MQLLLSKLLTKFVKPLVMQKYLESDVPFADTRNQVEDSRLHIRLVTSSEIQKRLNGGDITQRNVNVFYLSVRECYMSAVAYVLKWFPFN